MTATTFSQATGKKNADASLATMVGKTIEIKSFETKAMKQKDSTGQEKESNIGYISAIVDNQETLLYTWSQIVLKQLSEIENKLPVLAKVGKKKSKTGMYIFLE